jgi:hypothetical protein
MTCDHVIRLASLAVTLAGCADSVVVRELPETPPFGNDRATVTGRVVDAEGAALPGATVTMRATGERATVDSSGTFVIDVAANTTLTLAATAPNMATTLVPQFVVSPDGSAAFTIPLVSGARIASLVALGPNPMGGAVAIVVKSVSGAAHAAEGVTVELTPSNLGTVLYAPESAGLPDPDPSLTAMGPGGDCIAWAVGVQPYVSIMAFSLHGVSQVEPPYAIDEVTWPGTFTIEAGALTLVTLLTP